MSETRLVPVILRSVSDGSVRLPLTASEADSFLRRLERELRLPKVLVDREAAEDGLVGLPARARTALEGDLVPLEIKLRLIGMLVEFFTDVEDLQDLDTYHLFWDSVCFELEPGQPREVLREALQNLHGDEAAETAIRLGLERLAAV